ncbi:PAF acetylhydrolase family protein [Glonium stellatum]|uniref:1-alkyl-2-acetylglycerophosphocholine esterase n=1 Tax=Glonium stellatum TaxID=574774 RepID=A0A8E2JYH4_9PEZI|nr:PAF acetylhydrolase family protein [Glonium stellatum]
MARFLAWQITLIPKPNGPYSVSLNTMKLVDTSRIDPFAPTPTNRAVMISLFYPVEKESCRTTCAVDYMPPATAAFEDSHFAGALPNGTFEAFKLQVCCDVESGRDRGPEELPVILFSPGARTSRLFYSALAQSLASTGYVVVTIDHPYDADVVEFPDGALVFGVNISATMPTLEKALSTRVSDASFVLSQLGLPSVVEQLVPEAQCAFDVSKAAMYGHSLGGATAVAAIQNHSRFSGGADIDRSLLLINQDIYKPIILFGREDHNRSNDASWAHAWDYFKGWKQELDLSDSGHYTYTDAPLLVKLTGLTLPPDLAAVVGSLDGFRAFKIVTTYVGAFMDFVLKGLKRSSNITKKDKPDASDTQPETGKCCEAI